MSDEGTDKIYAMRKTYTDGGFRQGNEPEAVALQALRKFLNIGSLGTNVRQQLENAITKALKLHEPT